MTSFKQLIEFFYPTRCLVCKQFGAVVHPQCESKLPYVKEPFCHQCSAPLQTGDKRCHSPLCDLPDSYRALTGVRSVFWHEAAGREAVLRLKYRGVASLRDWAAKEAAEALNRFQLAGHFDAVMAVPLHQQHLRQRGYNQAGIVAAAMAPRLRRPYQGQRLVRQRPTTSQVQLNARQRASNVRDAFRWTGAPLSGQRILLFDDVCTTGATLNECARSLKAAGAGEVWALTLTREYLK
jgi:ComF family protein